MESSVNNKRGQGHSVQPFVSVIVPVYNGLQTIAACIESLLAQEYPRELYEIIVVDNNSTDSTDKTVQRYSVTLLYELTLQTPAAARNRGIQAARGDILAFIDADCIASSTWLQLLVAPLVDPVVGAVSGSIEGYQPQPLVEQFFDTLKPYAVDSEQRFVPLLTGNMACRRSLVEQLGLFDEHLSTAEDLDLGWRIQATAGKRIVYQPEALVHHKYRSTVRGLFHQYRRYGFSEILVDTLFKGKAVCPRTPRQQLVTMLHQIRALTTYALSFLRRCVTWPKHRYSREDLFWPGLWLVVEGGNLLGKLEGLVATRFFRRNPFPSRSDIVR